ncbi:MAG: hypothetical protein AAB834_04635, partial [Patescibacteria group bacterium]
MAHRKTAVLIHGCHLQANLNGQNWESIAFGSEDGTSVTLEGRAVMGIKVALDSVAAVVIFSTGASERSGVKEAQYTFNHAQARIEVIAQAVGHPAARVERLLRQQVDLDLVSQNTYEECQRTFERCREWNVEQIIFVSSPWHIQRCLTEGLKVANEMRQNGHRVPEVQATASYGPVEGVVVLEPSHRG